MSTSLTICHGSRRALECSWCTVRDNWWNPQAIDSARRIFRPRAPVGRGSVVAPRCRGAPSPCWCWSDHSSLCPRRGRCAVDAGHVVVMGSSLKRADRSQVLDSEQRGPQAGGDDAVVGAQPATRVPEVGEQYFRVGHRDRLQVDAGTQLVRHRCTGVGDRDRVRVHDRGRAQPLSAVTWSSKKLKTYGPRTSRNVPGCCARMEHRRPRVSGSRVV